jgi:hypothetical protein
MLNRGHPIEVVAERLIRPDDLDLFRWAKGDLNPHVPKDTGT